MKKSKLIALLLCLVLSLSLFAACKDNSVTDNTTTPPATSPAGEVTTDAPADTTTVPSVTPTPEGPYIPSDTGWNDPKDYTFYASVTSFGDDWNPHTWQTNADSAVLDYISSGLYTFKFNDEMHAELYPLLAASDPIDITSSLTAAQREKYGVPADANSSYAYQYTLRDNATFENGAKITAQMFLDSLKLDLDPARNNERAAEELQGEDPIAGANGYFNQGKITKITTTAETDVTGKNVYFTTTHPVPWFGGTFEEVLGAGPDYYPYYITEDGTNLIEKWSAFEEANGGFDDEGYFLIPAESLAEFEADWTEICLAEGGGYDGEWKEFIYITGEDFSDPKYASFDNVGFIVDSELTFTIVYEKKVSMFNAKYYKTSTWLVEPAFYESLSSNDTGLLTTRYGTTIDTTISYGPYKLASYEVDKEMLFTRNESWFGWSMREHDGAFQADAIKLTMVADQATELLGFLKGEFEEVTLSATDLIEYGTSDYLQVSPLTYQHRFFWDIGLDDLKALDADSSTNSNTVALSNTSFRVALSFALNRAELCKILPNVPGFALMNDLYTYDYEGELRDGVPYRYRDLDVAKEAILNMYGIKYGAGTPYATLDIAVDSVTGFDPEQAKSLLKTAFEELSASAADTGFDPSKPVNIKVGYMRAALDATALAVQEELNKELASAADGTGFVGIVFEFNSDGDRYNGVTDGRLAISFGAIGGARQDPFGLTDTFLNPKYSLFLGANIPVMTDTLAITADFDENPATPDTTRTETLYNWGQILQIELFESGYLVKSQILAAIETYYVQHGYTLIIGPNVEKSLHSIRTQYPTEEYDPVMAFGGIQYCTFTMDDAEWASYISANGGNLNYK